MIRLVQDKTHHRETQCNKATASSCNYCTDEAGFTPITPSCVTQLEAEGCDTKSSTADKLACLKTKMGPCATKGEDGTDLLLGTPACYAGHHLKQVDVKDGSKERIKFECTKCENSKNPRGA